MSSLLSQTGLFQVFFVFFFFLLAGTVSQELTAEYTAHNWAPWHSQLWGLQGYQQPLLMGRGLHCQSACIEEKNKQTKNTLKPPPHTWGFTPPLCTDTGLLEPGCQRGSRACCEERPGLAPASAEAAPPQPLPSQSVTPVAPL